MRKRAAFAILAVAVTGVAGAQEARDDQDTRSEPVRQIRVLQNPYDIASFYRSAPSSSYFGYQGPGLEYRGPYSLAGFYRSQHSPTYPPAEGPYAYGRFWNSGYGRGGVVVGFRRRIGQNGDLFLLAPTILAPVGPLAGAFFEGR
ncbi:MAG TPA: hypothetical protein VN375_16660 [Vicinamibacteria bacterium]|jgi:hypothetical protein|nr:hypothetical protein [Vicinamibacteria bacterium]